MPITISMTLFVMGILYLIFNYQTKRTKKKRHKKRVTIIYQLFQE